MLDLAASVFANAWPEAGVPRWLVGTLGAILTFSHFGSYPFIFSIERGNCDAYPQLFSVIALWLMVKRPRWLWLPVILITMAVHIKIYPAILYGLLFGVPLEVHVPIAVRMPSVSSCWAGRPIRISARYSASWLRSTSPGRATILPAPSTPPSWCRMDMGRRGSQAAGSGKLGTVALGAWVLWRRASALPTRCGCTPSRTVMSIVPSTSHDYKLIILVTPIAAMLLGGMARLAAGQFWRPLLVLTGSLFAAYWLSGSYVLATSAWWANKYPFVLLFELVVWADILMSGSELQRESGGASFRQAEAI